MNTLGTKDLIQIGIFTAILSVASVFVIPIGPVPITLQVFFFLLIPALLGALKGFLTILLYTILGLSGMPIFAGGTGGIQSILSPSFGYIIGALLISLLIGKLSRYSVSFTNTTFLMVAAIFFLYAVGILYQYILMNVFLSTPVTWRTIFLTNILTFFPIDLIKALFASTICVRLKSISSIQI